MKVVLADYPTGLLAGRKHEVSVLKNRHPDWEVVFCVYDDTDKEKFLAELSDADALITAFIKIDETLLKYAPNLKLISIDATGYNNVDLVAATHHNVKVCTVSDYCSDDVAEFTIALIFALSKRLKGYTHAIDNQQIWDNAIFTPPVRLNRQCLGILGLGRIGQKVATRAQALGMSVIAYDPYLPSKIAEKMQIKLVNTTELYQQADFISNHMRLDDSTRDFFDTAAFNEMSEKKPYFINVARGESVVESALIDALDTDKISGAALDVLRSEHPTLDNNPLLNRTNVLLSPHAAFYSQTSLYELERISCENVVNFFEHHYEKIDNFVN